MQSHSNNCSRHCTGVPTERGTVRTNPTLSECIGGTPRHSIYGSAKSHKSRPPGKIPRGRRLLCSSNEMGRSIHSVLVVGSGSILETAVSAWKSFEALSVDTFETRLADGRKYDLPSVKTHPPERWKVFAAISSECL